MIVDVELYKLQDQAAVRLTLMAESPNGSRVGFAILLIGKQVKDAQEFLKRAKALGVKGA